MLQFLSKNSSNPPYIIIETVSDTVNNNEESPAEIVTNIPDETTENLAPKTLWKAILSLQCSLH